MGRAKNRKVLKVENLSIQFNAPVVLGFTVICLIALLANEVTAGQSRTLLFSVYHFPLNDALGYVRLFTHVVGHASLEHFSGNIILILVIGPALEDRYGSGNMAVCILLTALVTGIMQCVFFPNASLCGASGVVFMMILLSSMGGVKSGHIPFTLIVVAIVYLGGEIKEAIFVQDNISQLSHILGGLCGAGMGFHLAAKGE